MSELFLNKEIKKKWKQKQELDKLVNQTTKEMLEMLEKDIFEKKSWSTFKESVDKTLISALLPKMIYNMKVKTNPPISKIVRDEKLNDTT